MQVRQFAELTRDPGTAFTLLRGGMPVVPHEVVRDELPPTLERVEEGEAAVGPGQFEGGVDLDHGKTAACRRDRVTFPGVRLLPDP